MQTYEVPRFEWASQLNEFTAVHDGWLVSVDVVQPRAGVREALHELPLLGIAIDDTGGNCRVTISVIRAGAGHVAHTIDRVTRVIVYVTDERADAGLQFDSADGVSTILRLRVAVLPERVDHVLRA